MKPTKTRKLRLSASTIRKLSDSELSGVAGAGVGTTSMDPLNATCGYSCSSCPTFYPPCCKTTSKVVSGNMLCV